MRAGGGYRPHVVVLAAVTALLNGCVNPTFAPGPGMLASDFGPDSARCRLFARGGMPQPGFMVGASGSPGFVAGAMGGAILASGIASAMAQS
jgi:hypothetical protein